jgi:hypothetical protein
VTCCAAYAPFTPSKSEQRLLPPYYRGCWHGVSRSLQMVPSSCRILARTYSSHSCEVYIPRNFILHAALLGQAFAHCPKFPTAASRRSLARVSVPVWPTALSGRLRIVALVGRYPANKLIRRGLLFRREVLRSPALTTVTIRCRCIMRY